MEFTGFRLRDFGRLLDTAIESGYEVYTVRGYLRSSDPDEPLLVLRHDVDRKVENALEMARVEAGRGVASTYYLRTSTFSPEVARELNALGHEVGYHYEDLSATGGDLDAAHRRFESNLASFREHVEVDTACAHGVPLSNVQNTNMWSGGIEPADYGLLGTAYQSIDVDGDDGSLTYFSDTGRSWDTDVPEWGTVRRTDDLERVVRTRTCPRIYLLVHPCRWAGSSVETIERVGWDLGAQTAKGVAARLRDLRVRVGRRGEGEPAARRGTGE